MLMRNGRRLACGLALVAGISTFADIGAASAAQNCAKPQEQKALQARILQTELMVAALQCQSSADYNEFVVKFRGELVERGKSLRQMFERQHGGGANSHLNALVTRLANQASQRSMAGPYGFCQQAKLLFAEAKSTEKVSFDSLAEKLVVNDHGVQPCDGNAPIVGYSTAGQKKEGTN